MISENTLFSGIVLREESESDAHPVVFGYVVFML